LGKLKGNGKGEKKIPEAAPPETTRGETALSTKREKERGLRGRKTAMSVSQFAQDPSGLQKRVETAWFTRKS